MARLTKFLLGGVVGAGLALLFAPKSGRELREMLMGESRPSLPPSEDLTPEATAPEVDLGAKIEETRQSLESDLQETFAPPETEATAPAQETPLEEIPVSEEVKAEVPPPAEAAAEEEAAVEEEAAGEEEVAVEEEVAMEEEAVPEEAPAEEAAPAATEAPAADEEFAALKTPAEGEPSLAEPAPEAGAATQEEEARPPESGAAKPPQPEPSGLDQEEMRRRIDETRARLKAKAFDTMMSGESFIEPEQEAEETEEEAAGLEFDREIEETVDESFKEAD